MNKYLGIKVISATETTKDCNEGYTVQYENGYISWSPKEVFEKAYMQIGKNNSITQKNVDDFIRSFEISTIGEKTTLVKAVLVNEFIIIETSSCVDAKNYDEKIGAEICKQKIKDNLWSYLGFMLQTGINGIK